MSDFYQILKREITPPDQSGNILISKNEQKTNQETQISAVDKSGKKNNLPKKIKPAKKKSSPRLKITARQKNFEKTLPKKSSEVESFLSLEISNPIWLTMSETAKLGGIQKRTVKRALRAGFMKYRIVESRYQVDLRSALIYLFSKKKLWNKVKEFGIGQYVEKWIK